MAPPAAASEAAAPEPCSRPFCSVTFCKVSELPRATCKMRNAAVPAAELRSIKSPSPNMVRLSALVPPMTGNPFGPSPFLPVVVLFTAVRSKVVSAARVMAFVPPALLAAVMSAMPTCRQVRPLVPLVVAQALDSSDRHGDGVRTGIPGRERIERSRVFWRRGSVGAALRRDRARRREHFAGQLARGPGQYRLGLGAEGRQLLDRLGG